jgi:signal transduction histidine kinase
MERSKSIPVFTEATAQAVRLTDAPVAILTVTGTSGDRIGSISGLEQFARLPTNPNLLLELSGLEYCHAQLMSGEDSFSVANFQNHPQLSQSVLFKVHGIQAYLGLPIITAAQDRLGTIAILDFKPRQFRDRDIDLLQLIGRLVASEFERKLLSQAQLNRWIGDLQYRSSPGFDDALAASEHGSIGGKPSIETDANPSSIEYPDRIIGVYPLENCHSQVQSEIQFKLLTHLAQELRTPLTSVLGMASVLQQEIYGPLSSKQKDYLGIIYHSGQQLVTIVDEISQLGGFVGSGNRNEHLQHQQLTLKSVDLEMLSQLALQSLEPLAQKKQQQIMLNLVGSSTSEPPNLGISSPVAIRIWSLDKDKVRQIIYYLCLSLIHASAVDCQISIQFVNLPDGLQMQIVTSDPDAIPRNHYLCEALELYHQGAQVRSTPSPHQDDSSLDRPSSRQDLRISLGLSRSQALAELHGGKIEVMTNGRGYQLTLPLIVADR